MTADKCEACGVGSVVPKAEPGRKFTYRRGFVLDVPADVEIPTCDNCGTRFIDMDLRDQIKARLKPKHDESQRDHISFLIGAIQDRTAASYREIEKACGLTPTYLSHVLSGRREASEQLIALLEAYAVCPSEVQRRLERKSAHDTASVKAALDATANTANPSEWDQVGEQQLTVAYRSVFVVIEGGKQGGKAA